MIGDTAEKLAAARRRSRGESDFSAKRLPPAAKVYLFAANVYPQDELRGAHKVELSP
jgi:hypothetical protein